MNLTRYEVVGDADGFQVRAARQKTSLREQWYRAADVEALVTPLLVDYIAVMDVMLQMAPESVERDKAAVRIRVAEVKRLLTTIKEPTT